MSRILDRKGERMDRLQKILAQAGVASRRGAEELITDGKVTVNGKVVTELGTKVDPLKDKITVDGRKITKQEPKTYILLNKPAGYVSTVKDPHGRPKVTDLLKGVKERVYPVGRLDAETEGLLLLTNDGDLAFGLTHPKHGVEKTYLAHVVGIPDGKKLRILRDGVRLDDGVTSPALVRRLTVIDGNALLEIKIHEGKNRQVRRMCETLGHPIMKLQRTEVGGLTLQGVPLGTYRRLTDEEIASLEKKLPKLKRPSTAWGVTQITETSENVSPQAQTRQSTVKPRTTYKDKAPWQGKKPGEDQYTAKPRRTGKDQAPWQGKKPGEGEYTPKPRNTGKEQAPWQGKKPGEEPYTPKPRNTGKDQAPWQGKKPGEGQYTSKPRTTGKEQAPWQGKKSGEGQFSSKPRNTGKDQAPWQAKKPGEDQFTSKPRTTGKEQAPWQGKKPGEDQYTSKPRKTGKNHAPWQAQKPSTKPTFGKKTGKR
jgi:pseudouridine synthase